MAWLSSMKSARVVLLRRARPELGQEVTLLLDVTGVGRGVLDMFHVVKVAPLAVPIHGGSNTTHQGREWHVPKKVWSMPLTALSQARPVRLALGERLPFAAEVKAEMHKPGQQIVYLSAEISEGSSQSICFLKNGS